MKLYLQLLIALIFIVSFSNVFPHVNLDSGLVAYYPFNGNAIDESGNGYNGTVYGATLTSDRFNQADKAYNFIYNGFSSDRIQVSGTSGLNFSTGGFSLSAWIKFSGSAGPGNNYPIVSKHICGEQSGYILMLYNGKLTFWLAGSSGYNILSTNEDYTDDMWHQVVAVYDESNQFIYVDGILKNSVAFNYSVINSADWALGGYNGCNGGFNGKVDEVKIYDRPLGAAEILEKYNSSKTDLIAYYPFNGNANDESGNNINPSYIGNGVTLTSDRFGLNNRAFYFDGNDGSYIRLPADYLPTTSRTISLWINTLDLSGGKVPFSYGGNGCNTSSFIMVINLTGNSAYNVTGHCNQSMISASYSTPPLYTWKHWVITIEGATQKLYIDGELKQTENNYVGSSYVNGRSAIIGGLIYIDGNTVYVDPNAGYFKGKIDDIRIYNHAITDQEVIALYNDSTTYTPPSLEDGLIAFYPFTGNPNDQSPTGNHATVFGATLTEDRFGVDNNAYYFNGNSRLQAADNPAYDFGPGNFSMNAWVNIETINTARIVSAGYNDNDGIWGLGFGENPAWGSGNRINFFVYSNNSFQDFSSNEITNYTVGNWAFVSVVKQNNTLKFFFNGQEAGFFPMNFQANSNSFLSMGCRQQASSVFDEFLIGKIDDIRIYNRFLSNEEIFSLYNDSTTYHPPLEEGLVAYWPFDANVSDSTFNNNDGINHNASFAMDRYGIDNSSLFFATGIESYVEGMNPGNNLPIGNSPRTFSAWINTGVYNQYGSNLFHYGTAQPSPTNFHFLITGVLGLGNGYGYGVVYGNINLIDSSWHFVTGVYEGGTERITKLYVDGKLDIFGTISTEPNTILGTNWRIGRFMEGSTNFNGNIDELKVYDIPLTDQQIWNKYKAATTSPNLIFPANNSTINTLTPVMDWDSLATATTYRIQIATDSLFSTIILSQFSDHSSYTINAGDLSANIDYYWRVRTNNNGGVGPWSEINKFRITLTDVEDEQQLPTEFALMQNYPNPFNPSTVISYQLPVSGNVILKVYDVLGNEIATLVDEYKPAGSYQIEFNVAQVSRPDLASGIYFYRLQAGGFVETEKLILMK
jgi:hypothetical protein